MRTLIRLSIIGLLVFQMPAQRGFFGSNYTPSGGASYLYYGPGCNGTSTNTCTIGGTTQSGIDSYTLGFSFTTGSNTNGYDVVSVLQYLSALDGSNPQINGAIYSNNSFVASLVCTPTADITPSAGAGWKENSNFTGCHLSPVTIYVIGFQNKGAGNTVVYDTGVELYGYLTGTSYGTFNAGGPWNNSTTARSNAVKVTATP